MIDGTTLVVTPLVSGNGGIAVLSARAVVRAELARRSARRASELRRHI
jgi:hypothetical protein